MASVDGLASGLDTTSLVEGLMATQKSRVDRLAAQRQKIEQEQTAVKSLEAGLLSLQSKMSSLTRSANNVFRTKVVKTNEPESVIATASETAASGIYSFRVTQLASTHQIKSNGFSDSESEITQGTFRLRVGQRAEASISITEANNSLQGLANAINVQSKDVSASVVNDGTGGASAYRLVLASRHTGAENAIQITQNLATTSGTAIQPAFAEPDVQAAADAVIQLGSGPGAISVRNADNQFDEVIPGVTIDAIKADPDKVIEVNVAEDSSAVKSAIQGFVDSYNEVITFVNSQSGFDAETGTGGLLLGNRTVSTVLSRMRSSLSTVVQGINDKVSVLSAIGVSTDGQGKLQFNSKKLDDILSGRIEGVSRDDVRRLFGIDGQSTNPSVRFLLGTSRTQASPRVGDPAVAVPYKIDITRAATQAELVADGPLSANTIIDADNKNFKLTFDGIKLDVAIPEGTYTRQELADQLETLINTADKIAGRVIVAEVNDANHLVLRSSNYGASSKVAIQANDANSTLGLTDDQSSAGQDVSGIIRINLPGEEEPIVETAKGSGRILTGDLKNEYTADLRLQVNLDATQISGENDAEVTVTRGVFAELDKTIGDLLNTEGLLKTANESFSSRIEVVKDSIDSLNERMERQRESLTAEFARLESTLSGLQSTGGFLSNALANLPRIR